MNTGGGRTNDFMSNNMSGVNDGSMFGQKDMSG